MSHGSIKNQWVLFVGTNHAENEHSERLKFSRTFHNLLHELVKWHCVTLCWVCNIFTTVHNKPLSLVMSRMGGSFELALAGESNKICSR